jgi:hypothetical protein
MLCIGFKGGVEARVHGLDDLALAVGAAGVVLSFVAPLIVFALGHRFARMDRATAAATAAAYGSVSVVTFAAASEFLAGVGKPPAGYLAAVLAVMETPAILSALILARRAPGAAPSATMGRTLHEVFCNGALMVLVGSFVIGLITGEGGMAKLDTFVNPIFQGALCFFLLDMGLTATRRLQAGPALSGRVLSLGICVPVASAAVALLAGVALGLRAPEGAMLMVLAGSASYIAVPAAMRLSLPEANAGVYVTLPLAVTFPFNLLVGIPLYAWASARVLGA